MDTASTELLVWVPKGVLFGLVICLMYFCWWVIKYVVKTKHKEIMEKFVNLDVHLMEVRDSMKEITNRMANMVTLEQHKETKAELKSYIYDVRGKIEDEIKSIKRRIELIESR